MSNNKQSMKLYTEEQILNAYYNGWHYRSVSFVNGEVGKFQFYRDVFINSLTPIELPSDEEIENYARLSGLVHPFVSRGAKWMRDKIQGGNK
jgi:hypothetical protein